MKKNLITAVLMTIVTTVLFGLLFPLLITGLAQVLFGLKVEVGAPQQGRQRLAPLRPGCCTGQIGQQARKFLARQVDDATRPGQLEASQQ